MLKLSNFDMYYLDNGLRYLKRPMMWLINNKHIKEIYFGHCFSLCLQNTHLDLLWGDDAP